MRVVGFGLIIALSAGVAAAQAGVTSVTANTTGEIQLTNGVVKTTKTYSGPNLSKAFGNTAPTGGALQTTSNATFPLVKFQNANSATGLNSYVTSHTSVDITFTNESTTPMNPILESTIMPGRFGMFIADYGGACNQNNPFACGETLKKLDMTLLAKDQGLPATQSLGGTRIDFKVSAGGQTLYEISSSISLDQDPITKVWSVNRVIDPDMSDLLGFKQFTSATDKAAVGYSWNLTPIVLKMGSLPLLNAYESRVISYETTVTTFSRNNCNNSLKRSCLVTYGGFGDPIGRGGQIDLTAFSSAFEGGASLRGAILGEDASLQSGPGKFGAVSFLYPTSKDGVIRFAPFGVDFSQSAPTPEPSVWALMILGFGLAGAALRRRRLVQA